LCLTFSQLIFYFLFNAKKLVKVLKMTSHINPSTCSSTIFSFLPYCPLLLSFSNCRSFHTSASASYNDPNLSYHYYNILKKPNNFVGNKIDQKFPLIILSSLYAQRSIIIFMELLCVRQNSFTLYGLICLFTCLHARTLPCFIGPTCRSSNETQKG